LPDETWACCRRAFITILGSRFLSYCFWPKRFRRASVIWVSTSSRCWRRTSASATRTMRSAASCSTASASW
jgi:hypothetical protein